MSSLTSALDNYTPKQLGENMHSEYGWSHELKEEILQVFFQLTRTSDKSTMERLGRRYQNLVSRVWASSNTHDAKLIWTLQKMAVQTRDIVAGKGEYRLGWYLINAFDKAGLGDTARKMIYYSVHPLTQDTASETKMDVHPYGSWKDIKYMWCEFTWSQETSNFMIKLINDQVHKDHALLNEGKAPESLVGRWVPRAKSKFGEMFGPLAKDYYSCYLETANNPTALEGAKRKAYGSYRTLIASLNRALKTPQVNMCGNTWSEIDYDKNVTSVTLSRSSKAFRNKTKTGEQRSTDKDRIQAAANYEDWLASKVKNGETVKGSRVGLNDLVKQAYRPSDQSEVDRINLQWKDGEDKIGNLGNIIAMVDTSGSMDGDPMNAAIGLGLCVAEKSLLGKRVMSFSATPRWCQLPEDDNFCRDVQTIRGLYDWGMNTNFTAALKLILDASVNAKLTSDQVGDLVLAVFSDMQIDYQGNESLTDSMWEHIEKMYAAYGYTKVPHILFWNLRSTTGFPSLSSQKNATMFSGFSPSLLNIFCDKGIDGLRECTPMSQLMEVLDHPRYKIFSPESNSVII